MRAEVPLQQAIYLSEVFFSLSSPCFVAKKTFGSICQFGEGGGGNGVRTYATSTRFFTGVKGEYFKQQHQQKQMSRWALMSIGVQQGRQGTAAITHKPAGTHQAARRSLPSDPSALHRPLVCGKVVFGRVLFPNNFL